MDRRELQLTQAVQGAYERGIMPEQMSYSGLNFDIVTGALALIVAALLWQGRAGLVAARAWNVLGTLLLANVVVIALLSSPTPLQQFRNGPTTAFVTQPAYVWLPTVMVAFAILGHVVVFRRLRAEAHGTR